MSAKSRFALLRRRENQSLWDMTFTDVGNIAVEYTESWIRYQSVYFMQSKEVIDDSYIVLDHGYPIGVWPLMRIIEPHGEVRLSGFGSPILEPRFRSNVGSRIAQHALRFCGDQLLRELASHEVGSARVRVQCGQGGALSEYVKPLLKTNCTTSLDWIMVADLLPTEVERWQIVRSSYRSLIRREMERSQVRVFQGERSAEQAIQILRGLHRSSAGRDTRSGETWECQRDAVAKQEAFVVIVFREGRPTGGSLVCVSNSEAVYSVGAYDRELMRQGSSAGHLTQWTAMNHLVNELGINRYRLGTIVGSQRRTKKELGIDLFKLGFVSRIESYPVIEIEDDSIHEVEALRVS